MDATIVIPVHNQLHFTRQCLASLNAAGYPDKMIVVVNNASTDGTAEFLATRSALRVLNNPENRACAAAWNQGFQASTTNWTVFLNNDTVLTPGWLDSLVAFAGKNYVTVTSPALGGGDLDYELNPFAREFTARMKNVARRGMAFGACFMVARDVFATVGGFDENFCKGGHEDADFFWRVRRAGFKLAVSGSSYIHHFGGMTQKAVNAEKGSHREENVVYYRAKWKIGWLKRRKMQLCRRAVGAWWAWRERLRYGHTLKEHHLKGKIYYR